jgi:hypothetical protein
MVSSILILSMRQLQRVDAVEVAEGSAGQEAFLRIEKKAVDAQKLNRKVKDG